MRVYILLVVLSLSGCNKLGRLTHGADAELAGFTPVPQGAFEKKELVILVGGQSNASQGGGGRYSDTGLVYVNDRFFYDIDTVYAATADRPANHSISFVYMAELITKQTGKKVTIINAALGGMSIDSLAGTESGPLLEAAQKYRPDYVLWIQGEADASTTKTVYYEKLKSLIDRTRTLSPNSQWFVALNGLYNTADDGPRGAQKQIISDGLAKEGPDVDSMRGNSQWVEPGAVHIIGEGYNEFGRRWFEILGKS